MTPLAECEIVIVGAGAVGLGAAYSLARAGRRDVLVLDREAGVGQVTSAQGAGLCGQVRASADRVRLAMQSVETFRELQQSPGARPEWNETGSLRIALSAGRADELRRLQAVCDAAGLEVALLDRAEAERLWPLDFGAAPAVLWCPSDGSMTPTAVTQAYEQQCRRMGVRFAFGTTVTGIDCRDGRVVAVRTDRGDVTCDLAVDAAGAHASHIARLVDLELPIVPVRHEFYDTVPLPGLHPSLPCFRIPEMTLYGRAVGECLRLGGWEADALSLDPRDFGLEERAPAVEPDEQVLDGFERRFARLFPAAAGAARTRVGSGWPTFTPDGRFVIGESRRVRGFVMAGGCNAHGISGSAGIGRLLVESLFDPDPGDYVRSLSPDRFTESSWDWETARRQAQRVYETYYAPGA
ncbi:MAG TPA: FAD-dependent oxidoreductase [Thermoleophilia bacterium]|nr:FAD-dependent oxidoreductase [Thermoleophilia bacterium]